MSPFSGSAAAEAAAGAGAFADCACAMPETNVRPLTVPTKRARIPIPGPLRLSTRTIPAYSQLCTNMQTIRHTNANRQEGFLQIRFSVTFFTDKWYFIGTHA